MKIGMHCYVSGKVQGVWFRASTKTEAERLGLTGWVRNLADGRVEVMAFGESEGVLALQQWLKVGPPQAEVSEVSNEEVAWEECSGFKQV